MTALISESNRCLLVAAAPLEAKAILRGLNLNDSAVLQTGDTLTLDTRFDLLLSGVGKSSAAASTARALTLNPYTSVLSIGIAGALPSENPIEIGQSILASRSYFSDEGIGTPSGFIPLSEIGFAPFENNSMGIDHTTEMLQLLAPLADHQGTIATVSWCSGDDACAQGVVDRTGAIAEAMEGAAVAVAAQLVDPAILTSELRVISNTTGGRDKQVWDLELALSNLSELAKLLGRC